MGKRKEQGAVCTSVGVFKLGDASRELQRMSDVHKKHASLRNLIRPSKNTQKITKKRRNLKHAMPPVHTYPSIPWQHFKQPATNI